MAELLVTPSPRCALCLAGQCGQEGRHKNCGKRNKMLTGRPVEAHPAITAVSGTDCCEDCAPVMLNRQAAGVPDWAGSG